MASRFFLCLVVLASSALLAAEAWTPSSTYYSIQQERRTPTRSFSTRNRSTPRAAAATTRRTLLSLQSSGSTTTNESTSSTEKDETSFTPIFDFTRPETIDQIDRLDDAIMGGISTSSVQPSLDGGFARWGGVCRTDGGGFCGFRTNPFAEPLLTGDSDGLYVQCRLVSDDEPERRVWKLTTRTKPDRGELLYQAPFDFTSKDRENWTTVKVPFDTFRFVRGPRMIPDGPPLDLSKGLYQIGMTMSKFAFGVNTTELENFRDGFFELQIKEIGLYKRITQEASQAATATATAVAAPKVLTKVEAKKQRPLLLKVLLPLSKIFFSEQSQRRKSAMRILREERKLSPAAAIWWGFRSRAASFGVIPSLAKTISILLVDTFRKTIATALKIIFLYPIQLLRKGLRVLTGKKKLPSMSE